MLLPVLLMMYGSAVTGGTLGSFKLAETTERAHLRPLTLHQRTGPRDLRVGAAMRSPVCRCRSGMQLSGADSVRTLTVQAPLG